MNSRIKVAEITLSYSSELCVTSLPQIHCSQDAHEIFRTLWNKNIGVQEEFNLLLLNRSNKVIGFINLSKGGISSTIVDLKIAFAAVLKSCSSSIVLAHNHPSGNLNPSTQDISLTEKFVEAGKLLEIKILDHLILTPDNQYYSFLDNGLII